MKTVCNLRVPDQKSPEIGRNRQKSLEWSGTADENCEGCRERVAMIRPERQLVYEWYTPSLERSVAFLEAVGFKVRRQEPGFAEMAWGFSVNRLFVEEVAGEEETAAAGYHGNIRILVEDVDAVYRVAQVLPDVRILKPLEDRYYGLRDFTLGGPYGLALRFATPLLGFIED